MLDIKKNAECAKNDCVLLELMLDGTMTQLNLFLFTGRSVIGDRLVNCQLHKLNKFLWCNLKVYKV